MLPAVEAMGGEIVECVVLVDRSGGRGDPHLADDRADVYPLRSLWQLDLPTYEPGPATCPRCADGTPLYAPGSTGTGTARRRGALTRPERWTGGPGTSSPLPSSWSSSPGRGAAVSARRPDEPTRDRRPDATAVVGVIVGVDSAGLDKVNGFTLRTTDAGPARVRASASLENGAQFPPGHLVEHQASAQPVRVWYRTDGGANGGDPARGRAQVRSRLGQAGADDRQDRVELGRRDRHLVGPLDDPVPVDGEDPRLGAAAPTGSVMSVACSWSFASSTGWSAPSIEAAACTARR